MPSRYAAAHASPGGPGDARPSALDIVKDEGLEGKLSDKVVLITGCSSGIGTMIPDSRSGELHFEKLIGW